MELHVKDEKKKGRKCGLCLPCELFFVSRGLGNPLSYPCIRFLNIDNKFQSKYRIIII